MKADVRCAVNRLELLSSSPTLHPMPYKKQTYAVWNLTYYSPSVALLTTSSQSHHSPPQRWTRMSALIQTSQSIPLPHLMVQTPKTRRPPQTPSTDNGRATAVRPNVSSFAPFLQRPTAIGASFATTTLSSPPFPQSSSLIPKPMTLPRRESLTTHKLLGEKHQSLFR